MFRSPLAGTEVFGVCFYLSRKFFPFMTNKNASPEMRTATYNVDAASGRRRRQNVM